MIDGTHTNRLALARTRTHAAASVLGIASVLLATGCASIPPVGQAGNMLPARPADPAEIRWPEAYQPDDATFFVHNEIEIEAPPEVVWEELINAGVWETWYEGASNVRVESEQPGRLSPDAVIHWRTMGQVFASRITEFSPPTRLSWESRKRLIKGYHAWLIIPTETGSRVVTDESQYGFLAVMQRLFLRRKLANLHDDWLAGLKERSEARHSGLAQPEPGA